MTIRVHFQLEAASYNLAGSSQQDSIIREQSVVDVFSASSHPDARELLILSCIFQLEAKDRGLDGIEQGG